MSREVLEFIPSIPKKVYIEAGNLLDAQTTVLVPVTVSEGNKPAIYIEGSSPVLICRAFLSEDDVEFYLGEISRKSNIDSLDLHFCPLPLKKLIMSLSKISDKTHKPIKCLMMVTHEGSLRDLGILWTNHEPFML